MKNKKLIAAFFLIVLAVGTIGIVIANNGDEEFTSEFFLDECTFKTIGENNYFILNPGYELEFEGEEDGESLRLEITVLNDKEKISIPDLGNLRTRVVEEREWLNDELIEVSRNFFAICKETNDVYYFGEEVDIYEDGEIVSHDGAWRAGVDGALPGLMMPGTFLLGAKYFQEIAPGIAMDRAENIEMNLEIDTEARDFEKCVRVLETTPLEPNADSEKVYCKGVGLTIDGDLELVEYG